MNDDQASVGSVPSLVPVHAATSAMPALIKSFPVPTSRAPGGVTEPLAQPSAGDVDPEGPALQQILGDAARLAPAWAARNIRPSTGGNDASELEARRRQLSPAAAATLGTIQRAMEEARASIDANVGEDPGRPTVDASGRDSGGNPWADRLRPRASRALQTPAATATAESTVEAPPAASAAATPSTKVPADAKVPTEATAPAGPAARTRSRTGAKASRPEGGVEPPAAAALERAAPTGDQSKSDGGGQQSNRTAAAAKEEEEVDSKKADPARPKRGRPPKAQQAASASEEADGSATVAQGDVVVEAANAVSEHSVGSAGAFPIALLHRLRTSLAGASSDIPHTTQPLLATVAGKCLAIAAAGSKEHKADAAGVGRAAVALGLALSIYARPSFGCRPDTDTAESVLDVLLPLQRHAGRLLRDLDDAAVESDAEGGAGVTKSSGKGKKGASPAIDKFVKSVISPLHEVLKSLHTLVERQFGASLDGAAAEGAEQASFVPDGQFARLEEAVVAAVFLPLRVETKLPDALAHACRLYIVSTALELASTVAALIPGASERLALEVERALPDASPAASAKLAVVSPDGPAPVEIGAIAALALRLAMSGARVPWLIEAPGGAAAGGNSAGGASHAVATNAVDPSVMLSKCHGVARHVIDGVITKYVGPESANRARGMALVKAFCDDLCAALAAPDVPIADYAVRHLVSMLSRSVLTADGSLVAKLPSAAASSLRKLAVDVIGAAALASLRASRFVDKESALCEIAWVTEANAASWKHLVETAAVRAGGASNVKQRGSKPRKKVQPETTEPAISIPTASEDAALHDRIEVVRFHALTCAFEHNPTRNLPYLLARQLYVCQWAAHGDNSTGHAPKPVVSDVSSKLHRSLLAPILRHQPGRSAAPATLEFGAATQRMLRSQQATVSASDKRSVFHPDGAESLLQRLLSCLRSVGADAESGWDAARGAATSAMAAIVKERPALMLSAFLAIKKALTDPGARVREAAVSLLCTLFDQAERHLCGTSSAVPQSAGGGMSQSQLSQSEIHAQEAMAGSMASALISLAHDRSSLVASKAVHGLVGLLQHSEWLLHHPFTERAILSTLIGLFANRGTAAAVIAEKHYAAITTALVQRWFGTAASDVDDDRRTKAAGAPAPAAGSAPQEDDSDDDRTYVARAADMARAQRAAKANHTAPTVCRDRRSERLSPAERLRSNAKELVWLAIDGLSAPFDFVHDMHPLAKALGRRPGAVVLRRNNSLATKRDDAEESGTDADAGQPAGPSGPAPATKAARGKSAIAAEPLRSRALHKSAEALVGLLVGVATGSLAALDDESASQGIAAPTFEAVDALRPTSEDGDALAANRRSAVVVLLHLLAGVASELIVPVSDALFGLLTELVGAAPRPDGDEKPAPLSANPDETGVALFHLCGLFRQSARTVAVTELHGLVTGLLHKYTGAHQQKVLVSAIGCLATVSARYAMCSIGQDAADVASMALLQPNRHIFGVLNLQFQRLRSVTKTAAAGDANAVAYGCRFLFLLSELLRVVDWKGPDQDGLPKLKTAPLPNMLEGQPSTSRVVALVYAAAMAFIEACPKDGAVKTRVLSVAVRVVASVCMQSPAELWPRCEPLMHNCLDASNSEVLHMQGLTAIRDFLQDEEQRVAVAVETSSAMQRAASRDLNSGMGTWVLQRFHGAVCRLAASPSHACRAVACEVLELAVSQGLLAPMVHVEPLAGLAADEPRSVSTSERAAKVLGAIADRHSDELAIKAVPAVIGAFDAAVSTHEGRGAAVTGYRHPTEWTPAESVHAPLFRLLAKSKRHRDQLLGGLLRHLHQDASLHGWLIQHGAADAAVASGTDADSVALVARHACFMRYLVSAVGTLPLAAETDAAAVFAQVRTAYDLGGEVSQTLLDRLADATTPAAIDAAFSSAERESHGRASAGPQVPDDSSPGGVASMERQASDVELSPRLLAAARVGGLLQLSALKRFLCKEYGLGSARVQRMLERVMQGGTAPAASSSLGARTPSSVAFQTFISDVHEAEEAVAALVRTLGTTSPQDAAAQQAPATKKRGGQKAKASKAGAGSTTTADVTAAVARVRMLLQHAFDDFAKDIVLTGSSREAGGRRGRGAETGGRKAGTKQTRSRRRRGRRASDTDSSDADSTSSDASSSDDEATDSDS